MHTYPTATTNRRTGLPWLLAFGVLLVVIVLVAACGTGDTAAGGDPPGEGTPILVDWISRTTPDATGEYRVRFCEGDGPFLCVEKDGEVIGAIELGDLPVGSYDVLRDALAGGATELEALEALAAGHAEHFAKDRADGCGAGYEFAADEPARVTVAGKPGLRYGFAVSLDGRVVERSISYAVIEGDTLYLLVAGGLDEGACLDHLNEMSVADLEAFAPVLDRLAAGSRLPAPTAEPPAEGDQRVVTARIKEIDTASASIELDELEILTGEEARQAAIEAGEIEPGENVPNDVWLRDTDATTERLTIDPDALVWVYDCTAGCEQVQVDLGAFLRHEVEPYGGELAVWEITITGDVITSVLEVYLP